MEQKNMNSKKKINSYLIRKILKNKYFWISLSFFIWISFFDTNSLVLHWKLEKNINQMILERDFYKKKIFLEEKILKKLKKDKTYLEKLAREKFYMKKDDEDLFVISSNKSKEEI
ncbi:septum formation initiator family protein [Blattabacterium cuenoti]|uniref:septum formation initiator family protein n=1 Tax=Blattabacterium cuenoti TaxID=1653831 RepID=UPI001EEC8976|nr:septum formation initiator family protein [Blattabacterium cuenoti]